MTSLIKATMDDLMVPSGTKSQPFAAATSRRLIRGRSPAGSHGDDGAGKPSVAAQVSMEAAGLTKLGGKASEKDFLSVFSPLRSLYKFFKDYLQHLIVISMTLAAVLMACSLRGDVALVAIILYKSYMSTMGYKDTPPLNVTNQNTSQEPELPQSIIINSPSAYEPILPDYLQIPDSYNLKDLLFHLVLGIGSSQIMYHGLCGFLQIYFYVLQRNNPEKWKCQPQRFLTRSNENHEIIVGTANMTIAGGMSGFLSCWIANGNYSTVYFEVGHYGYPYFASSIIFLFLWFEAGAYYSHALLHTPWFYKNCHKQHHRYHSPTAYSVIAMSPFELAFYDSLMILPLFLFPIHGVVYVVELVYVYYFGLMDHSGIKMVSWFPWQPDTMFHDDHHKYFHVNFGFNSRLFDWLHGTLRDDTREYSETIFGGKGREKREK